MMIKVEMEEFSSFPLYKWML